MDSNAHAICFLLCKCSNQRLRLSYKVIAVMLTDSLKESKFLRYFFPLHLIKHQNNANASALKMPEYALVIWLTEKKPPQKMKKPHRIKTTNNTCRPEANQRNTGCHRKFRLNTQLVPHRIDLFDNILIHTDSPAPLTLRFSWQFIGGVKTYFAAQP